LCVAFAYTHSDSDGNANSDGNGISITNAYSNVNAQADSDSETGSHTAAASHTAASAVSVGSYTQLSLGTREAIREFPKSRELLIFRARQAKDKGGTRCPQRLGLSRPPARQSRRRSTLNRSLITKYSLFQNQGRGASVRRGFDCGITFAILIDRMLRSSPPSPVFSKNTPLKKKC